MKKKFSIFLITITLTCLSAEVKNNPIYFIMIDRFNDSSPNDFQHSKTDIRQFYGGDINGITKKLDYIKKMDFKSIWISPVFDGREVDFFGYWGFHGYWPVDLKAVDKRFGTLTDLKNLTQEAHKQDIKIILDMVFNHLDYDAPLVKEKPGMFHERKDINNWNDPYELENHSLARLPDLDQDNPATYKYLLDAAEFWINEIKPDGFRMDAVKHIPKKFWKKFISDIRERTGKDFTIIGEVLHSDAIITSDYLSQSGFDGLFDFPLYYKLTEVFAQDGNCNILKDHFFTDSYYDDPRKLYNFIDNHDVDRFASLTGGMKSSEKIKLALSFIYIIRGNPIVYYGTEAELLGEGEPENRSPMEWDNNNPDIVNHLAMLSKLKNSFPVLTDGLQKTLFSSDKIFSILRVNNDTAAIAIFNNDYIMNKFIIELPEEITIGQNKITDSILKERAVISENSGKREIIGEIPGKSALLFIIKNPGKYKLYRNKIQNEHSEKKMELIKKVSIQFEVSNLFMDFGEKLYLTGSSGDIGSWNYKAGIGPFTAAGDGKWILSAEISLNEKIEFKFVRLSDNLSPKWEKGENHIIYPDKEKDKRVIKIIWK